MDWVMDHFGYVFVAGLTIIFCLVALVAVNDSKKEARFMAECQQDHKRYECEALWRQGEPQTIVAPMPVYVGHF